MSYTHSLINKNNNLMTAAFIDPSLCAPQTVPYEYKPLRIVLLGYRSHPYVGGQGIYLKYLSRALTQLGHQVDVISGEPYPQLDDNVRLIKLPGLNLYEHPDPLRAIRWQHLTRKEDFFEWWSKMTGGFGEPKAFGLRLERYLKQQQIEGKPAYDIIHDNQSLTRSLLRLQEIYPLAATIHHPISRDFSLALHDCKNWIDRLFTRRWYYFVKEQRLVSQQLKHVITVSESSQKDIADHFGRPPGKSHCIFNGIDTELFRPIKDIQKVPLRIICTTSSEQAIKGFDVLLNALKQLRDIIPQAHLRVIGSLKKNGKNQKLIEQLKLEDAVSFKSQLSDQALVEEYNKASVAVCPSLYEGFGLPACEAMACGTPLVSSSGGALKEVVADGGVLVTPGDANALANAIERVLTNPEYANQIELKGRARALTIFSWENVARQVQEFYFQIIQAHHANR